jgi:glucose/arabinose dehydrogenase
MSALAYVGILALLSIQSVSLGELPNAEAGEQARASEAPAIDLVPVVTHGLRSPLFLTHAGDGSGHLFIVEQAGTIQVVVQGVLQDKPFLDITKRVLSGGERGLLGLAFHPDYRRNGRFFVNYTRQRDGATVLAEYHRDGQTLQALPDERVLMTVPQPFANHNGGMVAFGPDGFLYVGRGDGGSKGDPQNRAQNTQELLGKILRIDVDRDQPYAIPADNPFARSGGRPEIFAYGVRNPWRFSFDRETKVLWLADVGQYEWEEIDLVTKGGNYGWHVTEGFHCYEPAQDCPIRGLTMPVFEYGHEKGRCSITGGYVYRGKAIPALRGTYVFGDFCSGEVFGLQADVSGTLRSEPDVLRKTRSRISSFGEDAAGELYVVDHGGGVYRISPPSR